MVSVLAVIYMVRCSTYIPRIFVFTSDTPMWLKLHKWLPESKYVETRTVTTMFVLMEHLLICNPKEGKHDNSVPFCVTP
jgi:hypothetical protein